MRKIIPAVVATATVAAIGGTYGIYQSLDNNVTLTIDGAPAQVSTMTKTVGDLLDEQGIEPGEHDLVAPAVDTPLNDGTRVSVRYGRPVTITLDGRPATHWTTGTSVGEVLDILQIKSAGADLSASRSRAIGRDGLELEVDTAKTITVILGGKSQVWETTSTNVGEAIADLSLEVDGDDIVLPTTVTSLTDGATVTVIKVDTKSETKTEPVPFKTVEKENPDLVRGDTRIAQKGKQGEKTLTYRVVTRDGKVVSSTVAKEEVTTKPVDKIVEVGTKAPAPKKKRTETKSSSGSAESSSGSSKSSSGSSSGSSKSSSGSSGSSQSGSDSSSSGSSGSSTPKSSAPKVSSGSVWDQLAKCESGGDWSINTGNGYYGGLQFSAQSWRAVGGSGLPHQHSREEQIKRAEILKSKQGWGAWPACTRKLGLR